jgi:hypothetical protein
MIAATVLSLAIVALDPSALRVAPTDTATIEATLYQGEALEVRGQKGEFLQVYDHRLERAGYIRAWQVRTHRHCCRWSDFCTMRRAKSRLVSRMRPLI